MISDQIRNDLEAHFANRVKNACCDHVERMRESGCSVAESVSSATAGISVFLAELMNMLHIDAEDFSALMSQVMERLRVKRQRQTQRYE